MSDNQVSSGHESHQRRNLVIGERVAALMWTKALTNRRMAQAMGVDPAALGKKLRGGRPWYLHEVSAMAQVLGTSMAYLTGETDDRRPLNAQVPASEETGTSDVVAGAGFEPTTSGL